MKIKTNKLIRNIGISVVVQIISLLTSFVLNLIVPKFIDVIEYSHWQTYILYASYVSILQFGLIDGMILKYSQYDYEELDKEEIRSQLRIFMIFLTLVAILTVVSSLIFLDGYYRILMILLSSSIITKNHFWYSGTLLQITYRINKYAQITIVQKISCLCIILTLLFCGVKNFVWYCVADLAGDIIGGVLAIIYSKELTFGKIKVKSALSNIINNVRQGSMLLFANLSASLLVGFAKMVIRWRWGEMTFGKVSLAFSLTHLFLTFVSAVSIVLFPSLKRTEESKLPIIYMSARDIISPLLILALSLYVPCAVLLNLWLPHYSESVVYLGILMPIIIFNARNNLLTNNYLKVLRKEKEMFFINAGSLALGVLIYLTAAYVFDSLVALLISVVLVEGIKFFISEIFVWKMLKCRRYKEFMVELTLVCAFWICVKSNNPWLGTLIYFVFAFAYAVYAFMKWKRAGIAHE